MDGYNRRLYKRTFILLNISVSESKEHYSVKFDTANISEGGVFIKSSILWEPDQKLDLAFRLPGSEKEITVEGKVVRNENKYNLSATTECNSLVHGMGIQFINISEEDKEIIRYFIKSGSQNN